MHISICSISYYLFYYVFIIYYYFYVFYYIYFVISIKKKSNHDFSLINYFYFSLGNFHLKIIKIYKINFKNILYTYLIIILEKK